MAGIEYEELVMRLRTAIFLRRKMKLGDAAREIGVSYATLYNILNMPMYRPSYATLEKMTAFIDNAKKSSV